MSKRLKYSLVCICLILLVAGALLPRNNTAPTKSSDYTVDNEQSYVSPAGIVYGKDLSAKFDSRIAHIMAHTRPDASKPKHSQFKATQREDVLRLLDEAWKKRGPPALQGGTFGRDVYDVDMKRVIGKQGERNIRMVMERAKPVIITAYPVHAKRRYDK